MSNHLSEVDGNLPQDLNLIWCIINLDDIVIFERSSQPSLEAGGCVPETGTGQVETEAFQM